MRKCVGVFLLISLMVSVANASWYWEGDVSDSWADANNWNDGSVSPPATIPHSPTENMRFGSGTATADMDDTMGNLHLGRSADANVGNVTLNVNAGKTLNVNVGSTELVSVAYTDGYTNNLNVSNGGRLNVWRGNGAGELRLNHTYFATTVGNLNLGNGGIVDTEDLNKGDRAGGGNFYGTGGTLVIRNEIDKFGLLTEDAGYGFRLGASTLEIAAVGGDDAGAPPPDYIHSIGDIEIGNSQDCDFIMSSESAIVFDLGDASGTAGIDWDYIGTEGNFYLDGTLIVNFVGYVPTEGDYWDVLSVEYDVGNYLGYGSFASLPSYIKASIVDAGSGYVDTLRLTFVPEPATIVLLGLGLLAVRRNKK